MFVGVKSLHGPEILYHTSLTSHSGSLPPKKLCIEKVACMSPLLPWPGLEINF